jgi:apolipoprotein D and lipocalin family protein
MAVGDVFARCVLVAIAIGVLAAPAGAQPLRVAEGVDLQRYAGKWYEIARFPNKFQNKCSADVVAQYTVRPDGRIDVINQCRDAGGRVTGTRGIARKGRAGNNAALQVRFAPAILSFLPSVWGDYWILAVGPDYTWSVVGTPSREFLWILSRTPTMSQASYAQAIEIVKGNNFDAGRLVRTPQKN